MSVTVKVQKPVGDMTTSIGVITQKKYLLPKYSMGK